MLVFKLQESLESATEKLKTLKQSIAGRAATAKEVNEINKYENLIYKYNKEKEDIKIKALDKSIIKLTAKIEGKEVSLWVDYERYSSELEFKTFLYDCLWNDVDNQEVLKAVKFSNIHIADFNKLTNDEKNLIIDNYKNRKKDV